MNDTVPVHGKSETGLLLQLPLRKFHHHLRLRQMLGMRKLDCGISGWSQCVRDPTKLARLLVEAFQLAHFTLGRLGHLA